MAEENIFYDLFQEENYFSKKNIYAPYCNQKIKIKTQDNIDFMRELESDSKLSF